MYRLVLVVSLAAALTTLHGVHAGWNHCDNSNARGRIDCGSPWTIPRECTEANCCWDTSIRGVPWCFFKQNECDVRKTERVDCGHLRISAAECAEKHCCFDNSTRGVKWCFFPRSHGDYHSHELEDGDSDIGHGHSGHSGDESDDEHDEDSTDRASKENEQKLGQEDVSKDDVDGDGNAISCSAVSVIDRTPCGGLDIAQTICHSIHCCYDVLNLNCYRNPYMTCRLNASDARQCGNATISKEQCHDGGCCWATNKLPLGFHCYHIKQTSSPENTQSLEPESSIGGKPNESDSLPKEGRSDDSQGYS